MEQTYDNLKDRAKIIRNELEEGANTSERVGGLMEDIVDKIRKNEKFRVLGQYNTLKELDLALPSGTLESGVYAVGAVTPYDYYAWYSGKWNNQGRLSDPLMVYNTTLNLFSIQDGSVVTQEQSTEVSNIMDKWNKGYIVTYVDSRNSSFYYGVLNACRSDDGIPTTLSVINYSGDLLAYSFEPIGVSTWSVINKTSNGSITPSSNKIYESTLSAEYLLNEIHEDESVSQIDLSEFINIIEKSRDGYIVKSKTDIKYTGRDSYGSVIFSISGINYSEGNLNVIFCSLGFITPDGFMINIEMKQNGSGYLWRKKIINIKSIGNRGYSNSCALITNSSTKTITNSGVFTFINSAPFLLKLNPRWKMSGSSYGCDILSVFILKDNITTVATFPTYQLDKSGDSDASVQVTITSNSIKIEIIVGTIISELTCGNAVVEYI